MKVGYCVPRLPQLASYRLRVAIPAPHMGLSYVIGKPSDTTFFFKSGDVLLANTLTCPIVYDVVNDHFSGSQATEYHGMCEVADVVTCASEVMSEIIGSETGREATVIDDPYENDECAAACDGSMVLWFGHGANIASLRPYAGLPNLEVCSNVHGSIPWSEQNERAYLAQCAVVLLTGTNPGASSNRIVKALRAGRFVVTPGGVESWGAFREFIHIGDVRSGIAWALHNREEACEKIKAGQEWVRERFSPQAIGQQWRNVFDLTSAAATNVSLDG